MSHRNYLYIPITVAIFTILMATANPLSAANTPNKMDAGMRGHAAQGNKMVTRLEKFLQSFVDCEASGRYVVIAGGGKQSIEVIAPSPLPKSSSAPIMEIRFNGPVEGGCQTEVTYLRFSVIPETEGKEMTCLLDNTKFFADAITEAEGSCQGPLANLIKRYRGVDLTGPNTPPGVDQEELIKAMFGVKDVATQSAKSMGQSSLSALPLKVNFKGNSYSLSSAIAYINPGVSDGPFSMPDSLEVKFSDKALACKHANSMLTFNRFEVTLSVVMAEAPIEIGTIGIINQQTKNSQFDSFEVERGLRIERIDSRPGGQVAGRIAFSQNNTTVSGEFSVPFCP